MSRTFLVWIHAQGEAVELERAIRVWGAKIILEEEGNGHVLTVVPKEEFHQGAPGRIYIVPARVTLTDQGRKAIEL